MPAGPRNHHWTKNILASPDGRGLYIAIGSNSNVAEHGLDEEHGRAEVWELDLKTGAHRTYASGLRNPVGMAWEPMTGALWVAVNERDELGPDLVPDYMTAVKDGGFYGWPYSYFGANLDDRVSPPRPDLVSPAIVPDYALGAHTGSLGLASATGNGLAPQLRGGDVRRPARLVEPHAAQRLQGGLRALRQTPAGRAASRRADRLRPGNGDAMGRPVGVAVDSRGGCWWPMTSATSYGA